MAVVSCFAIQNSSSHCAYCGQPLKQHLNAWRSSSGKMYCSEFCADDEEEANFQNRRQWRTSAKASPNKDTQSPAYTTAARASGHYRRAAEQRDEFASL